MMVILEVVVLCESKDFMDSIQKAELVTNSHLRLAHGLVGVLREMRNTELLGSNDYLISLSSPLQDGHQSVVLFHGLHDVGSGCQHWQVKNTLESD